MSQDLTLQERVHEALDNAKDNGYDQTLFSDDAIIDDLFSCADYIVDGIEPEALVSFVQSWKAKQGVTS